MAFKNEYIQPLDQETSDFFKQARKTLRTGNNRSDSWTVDRETNRVLFCSGRGHERDDSDDEYWDYLDETGHYSFTTTRILIDRLSEGPSEKWVVTRDIKKFWGHSPYKGLPEMKSLKDLKFAFEVYGPFGISSNDDECQHTLLLQGEIV
jgi:hypothetical protein